MLENLSDNFPQRQQEFRCYLDRRKQTPIHTYWKSSFGTIIFSEEFYKLLVKGPNKCCNKVRPVLTSFLIVYALTPMLLLLSHFSRVRLCATTDGSPSGSPVPGILQARTWEWVAISFSNAWKWKVKVKLFSRVRLFVTPWTAAHQAPPSMGFSRQEYWSGVPLPSLTPMLMNSIILTDVGQFPSSKNFNSIEPQFFKAHNVSGMGLMAYTH